MDFSKVSFKDFENVRIKATYNMNVGGRQIEAGETLAKFDTIQISGLNQKTKVITARGGYNNPIHVIWAIPQELNLTFSAGVFSKTEFALLTNAKMIQKMDTPITISHTEELESDEEGRFLLSHAVNQLFVYNKLTGEKLSYVLQQDHQTVVINDPYTEVQADYTYEYDGDITSYSIGAEVFRGYVELEGITRLKDDNTGEVVTGIIKVPRLKLTSNLALRLGKGSQPIAANFSGIGLPIEGKDNNYSLEFYVLSDDIQADI